MLRKASLFLAAVGLLDALYLTWIKFTGNEAACTGIGDCSVVNASQFADIGGIPIALFGALAYLAIILLLWQEGRLDFVTENGPMMVFGLSLAGVLYSAYLTYIELYVIHAICPFCVGSAVIMVLLLVCSWLRLRRQWAIS